MTFGVVTSSLKAVRCPWCLFITYGTSGGGGGQSDCGRSSSRHGGSDRSLYLGLEMHLSRAPFVVVTLLIQLVFVGYRVARHMRVLSLSFFYTKQYNITSAPKAHVN